MQKRMFIFIFVILLVFMAFGCTTQAKMPVAVQAEAAITPVPTPPVAVTRADFPSLYLPGLAQAGIIPAQEYHIGIVYGMDKGAAFSELEKLCQNYEDSLGIQVALVQTAPHRQAAAVEEVLDKDIDFLIFAPGGDDALTEADTQCVQHDVPYITIGRRIEASPGKGSYVCSIEPDYYLTGVLTGLSVVKTMKAEYGRPFGNIAEITGVVSDEASVLRSIGLRRVLSRYTSLGVVCSVAGNNDKNTVYKAAVNIFKAYREGELDGIVVPDDAAALVVLQAAADYDRDDVTGRIWSVGATVDGLTGVWYGQLAQTVETTGQTGMAAMEYALQYLEGNKEDIPPVVTAMTRSFTAETPDKADGIARLIAALKDCGAQSSLESIGDYVLFMPDETQLLEVYPKRYDTYTEVQSFLGALEPYTTKDAVYLPPRENEES